MSIGRRRIVLIEKFFQLKPTQRELTEVFTPLITPIFDTELFIKNRFFVELETSDGVIIDENRVRGFKMESQGKHKILKIKTFLHLQEWLSDYEKVVVARIHLLDSIGNTAKNLDLDVIFDGHSIECDYGDNGHMTPCFSYVVVGD